jgi:non-specific serine/threonine protein kinase
MGRVYEATREDTSQRVAVKVLSEGLRDASMHAERLHREALAARAIRSPYVAEVIDAGSESETGVPFLVMEYLEGETLEERVHRAAPLDPMGALRIALQVCEGLGAAHKEGLIHRDIKPANLFLTHAGPDQVITKVLDFGLAKRFRGDEVAEWGSLTRTGGLVGSPYYMSPEQARGRRDLDARTDLWSLGVVLFWSIFGSPPHHGAEGLGELIINICRKPAPRLDEIAPWVPTPIARLVERALAIDPARRFQSADEMREAILALGIIEASTISTASLVGDRLQKRRSDRTEETIVNAPASSQEQLTIALQRSDLLDAPATRPNRLPTPITSFVGRESEVAELRKLVATTRLVTLLGPGGTGKTRLALRVASEIEPRFQDGASFVDLSPITSADGITPATAAALGVRGEPDQPLLTALVRHLASRQHLLVLDNCEHLVGSVAAFVAHVLRACPNIFVLATSREALAIDGETSYAVAPLPVPDQSVSVTHETASDSAAVQLFVARAKAVTSRFELTAEVAPAVVHICRRLDGIPLAIELAAARVRVMSVEQIAARIDDRFRLLTGVRRATSHRQETLRALIDWSHDLLTTPERAMLRRLSVFHGGFSLEAVEAVCAWDGDPDELEAFGVIDLLGQLVAKSLVVMTNQESAQGGEARYRTLETIRHYAADKLRGAADETSTIQRHIDYFLTLAERTEPLLRSGRQLDELTRLDREHDNLRAALDACEAAPERAATGLRLAAALGRYWWLRGHHAEGGARLERLLKLAPHAPVLIRAKASCQCALLEPSILEAHAAWLTALDTYRASNDDAGVAYAIVGAIEWELRQKDREATAPLLREGLARARAASDPWLLARMLTELGNYHRHRLELGEARRVLEEGLSLARKTGDRWLIGIVLRALALTISFDGDYVHAVQLERECLTLQETLGFKGSMAETFAALGGALVCLGDYDEGSRCHNQALRLAEEIGSTDLVAKSLLDIAELALLRNNLPESRRSLRAFFELGDRITRKDNLAWGLLGLAALCHREGHAEEAIRVFGAESAFERTAGFALHPEWRKSYEEQLAQLRERHVEIAERAWEEGQRQPFAQTLRAALVYLSA